MVDEKKQLHWRTWIIKISFNSDFNQGFLGLPKNDQDSECWKTITANNCQLKLGPTHILRALFPGKLLDRTMVLRGAADQVEIASFLSLFVSWCFYAVKRAIFF